jgi:hypothetical protein
MAGRAGRNGVAQKNYYAAYQSKAAKNRAAKLERHQKRHPNDKQGGGTSYRKSSPKEVSGWLTAGVDFILTPRQTTPLTTKGSNGKKESGIPACAESLKEMSNSDRKKFAKLYARVRRIQAHNDAYGKAKTKAAV